MKALLICPAEREGVAALAESVPLSNLPILGKRLIEYWLEHLVALGAREVHLLASDRPEQVRGLVGSGERWGMQVIVHPETRELTPAEARAKYRTASDPTCMAAPHDITLVDHLPALPEFPLFNSYAGWFAALQAWLPGAATPDRIGVREIKPGVWAGLHTRIASDAELRAPCWIGERVYVGSGTVVGPMAILENESFVEAGTEISHSMIGPKTLVGKFTEVRRSIAWGSTLISWHLNSCIKVSEPFLLCSMAPRPSAFKPVGVFGRIAAALALMLTLPLALFPALKSKLRGVPVLRPLLAVRPRAAHTVSLPGDTLIYYELASVKGWLRRWPQLWHIMRGHFAWVGNRPISPREASRLTNDFERLWLAAPLGLLSLADTEGATHFYSDDTRAHASYYAVRAGRRLDIAIFLRALFLFVFGFPYSRVRRYSAQLQSIYAAGRGAS